MKPDSAAYYIKNNKGRAAIIILMMFLTTCMFLAGNYISSLWWFYEDTQVYSEKMAVVGVLPTDTDLSEWASFWEDINKDEKLTVLGRSGRGFGGASVKTAMGFDVGVPVYVFNSADDMQRAFAAFGIDYDCTGLPDCTMITSRVLADNLGWEIGRIGNDKSFELRGLVDEGCFAIFLIYEEPEDRLYRANILSDTMSGDELISYIDKIRDGRKVNIEMSMVEDVLRQMMPAKVIFYAALIIISVILVFTLNSVVTGQYTKREYEFAVYRAIGMPKRRIKRKIAAEMILMDLIAVVIGLGVQLLFTFIVNELVYIPKGQFLPYCSTMGVQGLLFSNLLVLLPMIWCKGHRMCKVDITEY